MSTVAVAQAMAAFLSAAKRPRRKPKSEATNTKSKRNQNFDDAITTNLGFGSKKKDLRWQCVRGCGACCKLEKGSSFPSPEDIFDDTSDVELYRSLIAPDGWCKYYLKSTRTCSIYADRPYFCRAEPDTFQKLFGIDKKNFNKEACCSCVDTIKSVYGSESKELDDFNRAIRTPVQSS